MDKTDGGAHTEGPEGPLARIREFLRGKTSYEVLPVSSKLVVLDTTLTVRAALLTMLQNGIISCPLWDAEERNYAGLITAADFIDVIHFYLSTNQPATLSSVTLKALNETKAALEAPPICTVTIDPFESLLDACKAINASRAHRVPLLSQDPDAGSDVVVSVLTQYRVLRFVTLNCRETRELDLPIKDIGLISRNVATIEMTATVQQAVAEFQRLGVSALPIVDEQGQVLNLYESYDVLTLTKGGSIAQDAHLSIGEALMRRPQDFEGFFTCSETDTLADICEIIRRVRVLRLCVVDASNKLQGILTLSDIMGYIAEGKSPRPV